MQSIAPSFFSVHFDPTPLFLFPAIRRSISMTVAVNLSFMAMQIRMAMKYSSLQKRACFFQVIEVGAFLLKNPGKFHSISSH